MTTALIDEFITHAQQMQSLAVRLGYANFAQQMQSLAVRLGYANFAQMMTDTLQALHDETLGEIERLRQAYEYSRIFGGMGSWYNSPPCTAYQMGLADEFDEITADFWAVRRRVGVLI